jgi:hypothetical protein
MGTQPVYHTARVVSCMSVRLSAEGGIVSSKTLTSWLPLCRYC